MRRNPGRLHCTLVAAFLATTTVSMRLGGQSNRAPRAAAAATLTDSVAVAHALARFLTAFENLDWPPFRAAFSDSATIFHPGPDMAERVAGARAIDSTFRAVFADIRAHATSGPPYHRLNATELHIQPLSPGLVLVTFQLRNAERLGRRTILFRKEGATWRILHLHASNIPTKP
jgi:hypothetical protein